MRGTLCSLSARYNIDICADHFGLAIRVLSCGELLKCGFVCLQRRRRVRLLQRGLGHCCGLRRQRSGRRGKRTEAFERRLQVFNARILLGRVCCRLHACNSAKGRQREKQAVSKINFNQNLVRIRPQRRTTCYVLNRPQYARLPCVPTRERGSR